LPRSPLTNILQDHVVPFAPHIGENFISMQDHARPHIARCVTNFLTETGDWPARFPDMNPIDRGADSVGARAPMRNKQWVPSTPENRHQETDQ
jgi:hypothetical protein